MAHNLPIGDLMSYYGRLLLSRPVLPYWLALSSAPPTVYFLNHIF